MRVLLLVGSAVLLGQSVGERVDILLRQRDFAGAYRVLDAELSKRPQDVELNRMAGVVLSAEQRYVEAEGYLKKACEKGGGSHVACYEWAQNLFLQNKYGAALERLKSVRDVRGRWLAAQCLDALGRSEEAEKEFVRAVREVRPGSAKGDPLLVYAKFLMREGRLEEARGKLEEHVKKFPGSLSGWQDLGRTYLELERGREAVGALEKAWMLAPGDEVTRVLLEKARRQSGSRIEE